MARPSTPPQMELFSAPRPAAGPGRLGIALGEVELDLVGLDSDLAETAGQRYGPWARPSAEGPGVLRVRVGREETDYFVAPPDGDERAFVLLACDGTRVRYLSYRVAGWFDTLGGEGVLLMSRGEFEPAIRALENYVRAAVAWQAASRGGALVHAAGAVLDGRGYLFYGASGAGKSTLAASNRRGTIISDDLSLVLPGENGGLELVGSPFRGTYEEGDPVVGRFPLAAGFRLVQASEPEVRSVNRVRALAELVGNLPFVAEAFARRPDLFDKLQAGFAKLPLAHLHFARDDRFWDAVRAAQG